MSRPFSVPTEFLFPLGYRLPDADGGARVRVGDRVVAVDDVRAVELWELMASGGDPARRWALDRAALTGLYRAHLLERGPSRAGVPGADTTDDQVGVVIDELIAGGLAIEMSGVGDGLRAAASGIRLLALLQFEGYDAVSGLTRVGLDGAGSVQLLARDAVLWTDSERTASLWDAAVAFSQLPALDERYPANWRDPMVQLPEVLQSARRLLTLGAGYLDLAATG